MLKFLIGISVFLLVVLIVQFIWIKIKVRRFCINVSFVKLVNDLLFESNELCEKYENSEIQLIVGDQIIEFEDFTVAVQYINFCTEEVLKEYEKIIEMTDQWDLSEHEKILNQIMHETKIWLWKHNSIEN